MDTLICQLFMKIQRIQYTPDERISRVKDCDKAAHTQLSFPLDLCTIDILITSYSLAASSITVAHRQDKGGKMTKGNTVFAECLKFPQASSVDADSLAIAGLEQITKVHRITPTFRSVL